MGMTDRYDLVIVGMGSAGIGAARFASTLGLRVGAVERHRIGGDCLWTGCVPSKALLASAKVAHHMRTADRFGIERVEPRVELEQVWRRIHRIQAAIRDAEDNREHFEAMGVEIVVGEARLTGPNLLEVGGRELRSRYVLLCTGSHPAVPPVPGLAEAGFVTSETIWEVERVPRSVIVLGGGPIGVELSQGLRRLGVDVTLLQSGDRILPRDEPELADTLAGVLRSEGVSLVLGSTCERITIEDGLKVAHGRPGERFGAEEIVVATGRTPNLDGLGLEEIGVDFSATGIDVDDRLRTSVKSIYAAGDVAGRYLFTHSAAYEASIAVRNMFFPGSSKAPSLVPWCTFTDPELAHAGLTEQDAIAAHGQARVTVHRAGLEHSDRARADGATEGAVILVAAKGKLVGAHLLAPGAGELTHELAFAIQDGRAVADLANLVHVYPTIATSVNLLAAEAAYEKARRYRWLIRR
jgi:pyruvate/2-oxoglutarate dehydrogenase complex dihydrolipoamide dehydrogenase (E3) component